MKPENLQRNGRVVRERRMFNFSPFVGWLYYSQNYFVYQEKRFKRLGLLTMDLPLDVQMYQKENHPFQSDSLE